MSRIYKTVAGAQKFTCKFSVMDYNMFADGVLSVGRLTEITCWYFNFTLSLMSTAYACLLADS